MADYTSDRSGASIDQVLDDADSSDVGKSSTLTAVSDAFGETSTKVFETANGATNNPPIATTFSHWQMFTKNTLGFIFSCATGAGPEARRLFFAAKNGTFDSFKEIFHTGNTGNVIFDELISAGERKVALGLGKGASSVRACQSGADISTIFTHWDFLNTNGIIGSIKTDGTTTSYNTSSDPRLKDFKELPKDVDIDTEFNKLYSCFKLFTWKNNPDGDLVWGFDAHMCVDAKLDIGIEGEGPRNLTIGDEYEPAVIDEEGVEIEPSKKVSPAGVDQAKAVPILLAKIAQLERRLAAGGL